MRRMQKFAVGATALLAAATVAQAQISNDVVRIGILADQTGPYSGNGGPGQVLAARMAVMAPEQVYRPLSENPCDFLKK